MPVRQGDDSIFDTPSDPASVEPPLGPPQSSTTPEETTEPRPGPDVASETEEIEPLPEFDPRFRQDFDGLLYIGKLSKTFTWMGHKFSIKTLTVDELLEVGLLQQPYVGSMGEMKAYQAAMAAAFLSKVDNKPISIPLSDDTKDLESKFTFIREHWFPPILDILYEEYLKLEIRVGEVLEAMGKASG